MLTDLRRWAAIMTLASINRFVRSIRVTSSISPISIVEELDSVGLAEDVEGDSAGTVVE